MSYETVTVVGTLLAVVLAVVISNWAMLRGFRTEVRGDISGLRTELKTDISELRTELKTDISELRTELKADIATGAKETALLRTDLKADISDLRTELVGLNQRIDATNSRIDRLADSLMSLRSVSAGV